MRLNIEYSEMLLDKMTNKITQQGYVAKILQLSFFLSVSWIEHTIYSYHLVFNLWNNFKNFLPKNRKMKRKNKIPKYYASNPIGTMKKIRNQSMKNFLTQ